MKIIPATKIAMLAITLLTLISCGGSSTPNPTATKDTTPPTITINGANPTTVIIGGTYTESGALATDNVDSSVSVSTSGSIDNTVIGVYTITYSATDSAGNNTSKTRTVNVVDKSVQTGFSFGSSLTLLRDAATFTRIATNNKINDVLYESSDSSVASIDMNSGLITILKIGSTTMTASSSGNSQYKPAFATFVLTVNQTLAQMFVGGVTFLKRNAPNEYQVSFNQATGEMAEETTVNCKINVANSTAINHFIYGDNDVIGRCGKGEVHGKLGSNKLNGQASFIFSDDRKMIYADSFSTDPNNPSGGFTGGREIPVISNIPLGTTETLKKNSGGRDLKVSRAIYNDGTNPAGTFVFIDSANSFGVSAGTEATSCERHHFVNQFGDFIFFTTIICDKYGAVYHENSYK